jgi:lycopene cyclase domain-containing protein
MREYTVVAGLAVAGVVALEVRILRTGLLRSRAYWISIAICYAFMILVNGWLTKLTAPVVRYDPNAVTWWRFPWDIPVEDYLFGFTLLTLTMLLWDTAAGRHHTRPEATSAAVPSAVTGRAREKAS